MFSTLYCVAADSGEQHNRMEWVMSARTRIPVKGIYRYVYRFNFCSDWRIFNARKIESYKVVAQSLRDRGAISVFVESPEDDTIVARFHAPITTDVK